MNLKIVDLGVEAVVAEVLGLGEGENRGFARHFSGRSRRTDFFFLGVGI